MRTQVKLSTYGGEPITAGMDALDTNLETKKVINMIEHDFTRALREYEDALNDRTRFAGLLKG